MCQRRQLCRTRRLQRCPCSDQARTHTHARCDLFEFRYDADHFKQLLALSEANVEESKDTIITAVTRAYLQKKHFQKKAARPQSQRGSGSSEAPPA